MNIARNRDFHITLLNFPHLYGSPVTVNHGNFLDVTRSTYTAPQKYIDMLKNGQPGKCKQSLLRDGEQEAGGHGRIGAAPLSHYDG